MRKNSPSPEAVCEFLVETSSWMSTKWNPDGEIYHVDLDILDCESLFFIKVTPMCMSTEDDVEVRVEVEV